MNARIARLHSKVFSTPQGSREREQAINSLSDSERTAVFNLEKDYMLGRITRQDIMDMERVESGTMTYSQYKKIMNNDCKGQLQELSQFAKENRELYRQYRDRYRKEREEYVWGKVKSNYWDQGAKLYWLDVAEPEYTTYDFANFRYQLGSVLEVGNIYPRMYTQGFYDGMTAEGDEAPVNLVRSAWAGSAKYGALVWSGDIDCTFECFNRQMRAGLSMAMAGIPWWTTDIGGFHGAETTDPEFRKLFVRWFAYACFCPVMRLHGNRNPQSGFEGDMISGIGLFGSGADNEVWSYGEEVYAVCKKYLELRERMRPYIRRVMEEAREKGTPVMRTLFYMYPGDEKCWEIEDEYFFGPDMLVAPVLYAGAVSRRVYLPEGERWIEYASGKEYEGGKEYQADAPLDTIPVYLRKGSRGF